MVLLDSELILSPVVVEENFLDQFVIEINVQLEDVICIGLDHEEVIHARVVDNIHRGRELGAASLPRGAGRALAGLLRYDRYVG